MKILLIDNYDSFVYNLAQIFRALPATTVDVYRNDALDVVNIDSYDALVLSPGPGLPQEAGQLLEVIKTYSETKPILGVCLGHQAIVQAFGGELQQLTKVYHGLATSIHTTETHPLFEGLPPSFEVGRYHSWVAKQPLPSCLQSIAFDDQQTIMAIAHKEKPIVGLQFHPESVLTPLGPQLIHHFIKQMIPIPLS